ncbi:MAG: leucine-rich repeat protein [Clostridia bacterium]|nr:leucine-rich repeat protein [Clostridia bacterium]
MKRRGIIFIVLVLVVLMAATLVACDETSATGVKSPTHLSFDNPYKITTALNPVYLTAEGMEAEEDDFDLESVKLFVEYSDGTKGEAVTVTESMLSTESTGDYINGNGRQAFTVQYIVGGVTVKGTFYVYTKVRSADEFATLTYITNGGTPNTFTKKVTKGTAYSTYTEFQNSFSQVTRAGYTLLGWVLLPTTYDYTTKTVQEIDTVANELADQNKLYSTTAFPSLGIDIGQDTVFCAVWQANTTSVTFNYNFAKFSITSDLYSGSGLPAEPVTNLYAPNSTILRPEILDNSVPGWKFVGWFTDEALTAVRSFNQQVGGLDIYLYAKWEQVFYSITFNLVGGELSDDQFIIDSNDLLYEKAAPAQTATSDLLRGEATKYDSTGALSRISYTELSYKKLFNNTSGTIYYYLARPAITIDTNHYISKGLYIDENTATSSYYYKFTGWYEDSDYTIPYNFISNSTMPARDLVLYAKWDIDEETSTQYYENYLFKDKYIVKADGTIKINGVNDLNVEKIALPNTINGKYISEIGEDAFAGCILLSSFSINQTSSMTSIGARAFRFCSKLSKIDVVQTDTQIVDIAKTTVQIKITSVGKDAFRGTTWLSSHTSDWITIGKVLVKYNGIESVQKIVPTVADIPANERDGDGDDDVTYITYGTKLANVDTICADAFKGLAKLSQIIIPNSIYTIENDAFVGCKNLALITVQEKDGGGYKLTNVGGSSFAETAWFKYPSSTDSNYAQYNALILGGIYYRFAGSRNTTTTMATVPAGISIIAPDAFQDFDNIRSIEFADKTSITDIGENAFNDTIWYRLQGEASDGFIIINGILVGYVGRGTTLTSADGLSTLVAVYVPSEDADGAPVTKIGTKAFYGYYANSINAISMPETITEIEPYAFVGATNLTAISYLGKTTPHIFNGVEDVVNDLPKISESSFYGATSGILVNTNLKIYLTNDTNAGGSSLYSLALVNDPTNLYYKLYNANNSFIQTLISNGIRVKTGTLATTYINSPGWSINAEWEATSAFDESNANRAVLVIMRSDGLPYEAPLERSYIDDATVNSSVTNSTPHSLTINYDTFTCDFQYNVEPKISSITIDNGASENSLMSQAVYFTTSTRFVYSGGYLTVNFVDAAVSSLRIALNDNVGADRRIQISGFSVSRAGTFELRFNYTLGLQSVYTYYDYTVATPKDVDIEFYEPMQTEINSTVDLSLVILKIICDDIKDGGQIFDVDGSGYDYYYVTMKNAKVNIMMIDGVAATEFDTSAEGIHTITLKYGSDTLGYTEPVTLNYEVVLKTLDAWFNYEVLSTTDVVWETVDGVDIYEGTVKITGIIAGHLPTVVITDYLTKVINEVTYRLKVVEIGASAFENDIEVVAVYIAATVARIDEKAFLNCTELNSVVFMAFESETPALTFIGNRAFEGCTKLTTISLPNGVVDVGSYAFKGSALVSIDLSNTAITELSSNIFEYCESLESIILPANLTVVGNNAFYGCIKLLSVDLGANIEYIGTYAFYYCDTLGTVTINTATIPIIGTMAFGVPNTGLFIKVPSASVAAYIDAWTSYADNISAI